MTAPVRLQRYLAAAGVAARRKAEELITAGRVTVNGEVVRVLGTKVNPAHDAVAVDGEAVAALDHFYVLFNKPKACITAVSDDRGRPTVMDYLPNTPVPVKPVGRLDFYSEGVLLLTNDGELAARLLAPASHVPKTYHVKVHGQLEHDHLRKLRDGVTLDDGTVTMPAEVEKLPGESKHTWLAITIHEGKQRQIHRMIESLGFFVDKLQRVAFANLTFHGLRVGDARELTQQELNELRDLVGLDHSAVSRGRWKVEREATDIPRRARAKAREEAGISDSFDEVDRDETESTESAPARPARDEGPGPRGERGRGAAGGREPRGARGYGAKAGGRDDRGGRGGYGAKTGGRDDRGGRGGYGAKTGGRDDRGGRGGYGAGAGGREDRGSRGFGPRAGGRDDRGAGGYGAKAGGREERGSRGFGPRAGGRDDRGAGGYGAKAGGREERGSRGFGPRAGGRDDRGAGGYGAKAGGREDRGSRGFGPRAGGRDDRGSAGYGAKAGGREDRGSRGFGPKPGGRDARGARGSGPAAGGPRAERSSRGERPARGGQGRTFGKRAPRR